MRQINLKRIVSPIAAFVLACGAFVAFADNDADKSGANVYFQRNLVSDLPDAADRQDKNLVNAWGLDRAPAGPWWVNAAGTGLSQVYDANGGAAPAANPLVVTIPSPDGTGHSSPTGIVFNGSQDFQVGTNAPALFLFATEDGTIAGWNPGVSAKTAITKVNRAGNAIYKGLTLGVMNGQNVLYAANFHAGTIEVYDSGFQPVTLPSSAFKDPKLPEGFAPFNVQNINGAIYVTYAMQDEDQEDDVPGAGFGYVDRYSPSGVLLLRLEHGKWLNAPWGITISPGGFGKLSNKLLVGNFGSGQIAAFNAESGEFQSMMNDPTGKPVTIDGLWGLRFGNGFAAGGVNVLYFAAGIQDEDHGLFGTLRPGPGQDDEQQSQDKRGDNAEGHDHN
jgi:uncharacterized protein (TIGR03118 family)